MYCAKMSMFTVTIYQITPVRILDQPLNSHMFLPDRYLIYVCVDYIREPRVRQSAIIEPAVYTLKRITDVASKSPFLLTLCSSQRFVISC